MALQKITLRINPAAYEMIKEAAEEDGVSTAQWIRESAIARMAYRRGKAGDPRWESAERVAEELERRLAAP